MIMDTVNTTTGGGSQEAVTEIFIRVVQPWAVPQEILDHTSFVAYGALVAYTSTKSFRNGFPQERRLKFSMAYLTAFLALSFASEVIHAPLWLPPIWKIIRIP
jgi:hypothetical protein